jgi:hypothetical protein
MAQLRVLLHLISGTGGLRMPTTVGMTSEKCLRLCQDKGTCGLTHRASTCGYHWSLGPQVLAKQPRR